MGCVPLIEPPGKSNVTGDFHRPYETQNVSHFAVQRKITDLTESGEWGMIIANI